MRFRLGLAAVYTFMVTGRVEIRDRGILVGHRLLTWPRVESYAWKQVRDESFVLTLRLRPSYWFLWRTMKFTLSADRRSEVEALLSRQFAEWSRANNRLRLSCEAPHRLMMVDD